MTGLELVLRDVHKSYGAGHGARQVLRGINLRIGAGEYLVVAGRSGSGKSTLLNLLGCLDQPSRGELLLNGQAVSSMSDAQLSRLRRRDVGFVFQAFNLVPTLTVVENLLVPLQLNGHGSADSMRRVLQLLDAAELADLGGRFPEELSGGEQQRVAILRAIAHQPAVLIADEPTGNLDLATARQTLSLLEDFGRQDGRSLIMATHSQEVMGRAERVLELRDGELVSPADAGQRA